MIIENCRVLVTSGAGFIGSNLTEVLLRQDPYGAYAAVIPRFAKNLLEHRQPVIFGDGSYSRDFTYIDNVVQANQLAALCPNPMRSIRSITSPAANA